MPVVFFTGHGDIPMTVKTIRLGSAHPPTHPLTRLRRSDGEAIVEAALRGGGFAQVPDKLIEDVLSNGSIVEVLGASRPSPFRRLSTYLSCHFKQTALVLPAACAPD